MKAKLVINGLNLRIKILDYVLKVNIENSKTLDRRYA